MAGQPLSAYSGTASRGINTDLLVNASCRTVSFDGPVLWNYYAASSTREDKSEDLGEGSSLDLPRVRKGKMGERKGWREKERVV